MSNIEFLKELLRRRTFAIISHPDAGKTTITEKILLYGKAINIAGTVRGRGCNRYVKSDWMEMEKQRGISITTSVMQLPYKENIINLLDTPGHEDFSEDTYRTLMAVDCCLMVIDATKGIEERTRKLMEVARFSKTPIITFMNKLDRDIRDPIELLDEVENELKISCTPITWPIGYGKIFKGIYHLYKDEFYYYQSGLGHSIHKAIIVKGLYNQEVNKIIGNELAYNLRNEIELIKGTLQSFKQKLFLDAKVTPIFFGTALGNFGIDHVLDSLITWGPSPKSRKTNIRTVVSREDKFSGFVFKIQANMDPKHHDRIAFMRVVSGKYQKGMKIHHVRTGKYMSVHDVLTFMVNDRLQTQESYPGDIIGLYNHGTIKIGDTFTEGENIFFSELPSFAPELFYRIRLRSPLKQKQLLKGLIHLAEEGAIQVFRPLLNNDLIVGALGILQFDMVITRLKSEYNVEAVYEKVNISIVRWVVCNDIKKFKEFQRKNEIDLVIDSRKNLAYIAANKVKFNIIKERYPEIIFHKIKTF